MGAGQDERRCHQTARLYVGAGSCTPAPRLDPRRRVLVRVARRVPLLRRVDGDLRARIPLIVRCAFDSWSPLSGSPPWSNAPPWPTPSRAPTSTPKCCRTTRRSCERSSSLRTSRESWTHGRSSTSSSGGDRRAGRGTGIAAVSDDTPPVVGRHLLTGRRQLSGGAAPPATVAAPTDIVSRPTRPAVPTGRAAPEGRAAVIITAAPSGPSAAATRATARPATSASSSPASPATSAAPTRAAPPTSPTV